MKHVKISSAHGSFTSQTPDGSGRWGDYLFEQDGERADYDYWIVCDGLAAIETAKCPKQNVILITWEPPQRVYLQSFVNQFAGVVTCHPKLRHPNVELSQQGHPWHIPRSYDQLKTDDPPQKSKLASVIASNKVLYEGHSKRLAFARELETRLGGQVSLFGRGINDFATKWEVLAPYRYSVAIENDLIPHWITEKLADCFLTETFPFYAGAPNAGEYFPTDSFIAIDLEDPARSIDVIKETINTPDHYESSLSALRSAKDIYLDRESLFPLLVRLLENRFPGNPEANPERIMLRPEHRTRPHWERAMRRILRRGS